MKVTTGCKNKNNEGKERQHRSKVQKKNQLRIRTKVFKYIFSTFSYNKFYISDYILVYQYQNDIYFLFLKSKEKEILKFSDGMLIKCSKKYIPFNLLFTIFYNTKFLCIFLLRQIHNSLREYR